MQTGNATFRQDIAQVIQENMLGAGQFVGLEVMPLLPVDARNGSFSKIAFSTVKTKAVDDKRGTSGYYNEVVHEVEEDTYNCKKRGLVEPVDDDDALVLGAYFDAEVSAADHCRYYLQLNREKRISTIAFATSTSYKDDAIAKWDDATNAQPVKDVDLAKNALIDQVNGMVGGGARIIGIGNNKARTNLRSTDDIKNRAYGGGNIQTTTISDAQLAEILGLDGVYFSGLKQAGSDIWASTIFGLFIVYDGQNLRSVPHYGRTMLWRDSTPTDMMVETYRDEGRESDMVRVKHNSVEKRLVDRAHRLITTIE